MVVQRSDQISVSLGERIEPVTWIKTQFKEDTEESSDNEESRDCVAEEELMRSRIKEIRRDININVEQKRTQKVKCLQQNKHKAEEQNKQNW